MGHSNWEKSYMISAEIWFQSQTSRAKGTADRVMLLRLFSLLPYTDRIPLVESTAFVTIPFSSDFF